MSIREKSDPELFRRVSEQNLLRQYDLLSNCIEIVAHKGVEYFDKYMLWQLNYTAVSNIAQFGGRYREEPIYVGNHRPPHYRDVSNLMDQYFSFVHENWDIEDALFLIPAYALWRLNWVHPFVEGNGRTARAACYLLLSVKYGDLIPGTTTVPELIRQDRTPYYKALQAADAAWAAGDFDVSELASYLQTLLSRQLSTS